MSSVYSKALRQPRVYNKIYKWDYQFHFTDFLDEDDLPLLSNGKFNPLASFVPNMDLMPLLNYISLQCTMNESSRLMDLINFNSNIIKLHFKRVKTHYDDAFINLSDFKSIF